MKKDSNKDVMLFILSIPVLLLLAFYISYKLENRFPPYTVENKNKMGYSVFYESLNQLNYPVERALKSLDNYQTDTIHIIPPGGRFDLNDSNVKKWIENGGILVYLTQETESQIEYGTPVKTKNHFKLYTYHKGTIIKVDSNTLINKTLIKDTKKAYELLQQIGNLSYEKLYFNESYLISTNTTKTLWDIVPLEIKYIIYQMIIVLCAFFYYKGKRFGKIVQFYEETERNENEYLYSVASLYMQAECWDLMISNYYNNFLKGFKSNKEEWIDYWEINKIPSLQRAKKVYKFMKYKKTRIKAKEYIKIITMIEYLNKIMETRRDLHWETLKKNIHVELQKK